MPAVETPTAEVAPPPPTDTPTQEAVPNGVTTALRALTGEEQRLYDRQLRLWGVEAQRRLSTACILIVGDVRAPIVQELAKNVVLTGIAKLTLYTPTPSPPDAVSTTCPPPSGLLGRDGASVVSGLRAMNCLVDVSVATEEPVVAEATVVCAAGLARTQEELLGARCRGARVPYLCGRVAGAVGWFFIDNGTGASYSEAVAAKWGGETRRSEYGWHVAQTILAFEHVHKRAPGGGKEDVAAVLELYAKLQSERAAASAKVETVVAAARAAGLSLPPVAAIVAGMWGREAIKLVSAEKVPVDNFFFFNAATSAGSVEKIGAK